MHILRRGLESRSSSNPQIGFPPDAIQLREVSKEYLEKGEKSYAKAEMRRQIQGYDALCGLLSLNDPEINRVLGIDKLPSGFRFRENFLTPSAKHEINTYIEIGDDKDCPSDRLKGLKLQVMAIRAQVNMADRRGKARAIGLSTQTGGGVRIEKGKSELIGDKTFRLENAVGVMEEIRDECGALSTAMGPKILGLQAEKLIHGFLETATLDPLDDREELVAKAESFYPSGGAKMDIKWAVPVFGSGQPKLTQEEDVYLRGMVMHKVGFILGEKGAVGPDIDRLAGDVDSGVKHPDGRGVLDDLLDGIIAGTKYRVESRGGKWTEALEQYYKATVTGKTGPDGLEAREAATGCGAWGAVLAAEQHIARKTGGHIDENGIPDHIKGMRTFFRGCGNASYRTIYEAAKAGMNVHGIAEFGALVISENPEGLKPEDAYELYQVSTQRRIIHEKLGEVKLKSIADWARWKMDQDPSRKFKIEEITDGDISQKTWEAVNNYWQEYQPQRIFEAARQEMINGENARLVPDGVVIYEIANGPITPIAAQVLKNRGVIWYPGILCNAGGVLMSMFEGIRNMIGARKFEVDDLEKVNAQVMHDNMEAIYAIRERLMERFPDVFGSIRVNEGLPIPGAFDMIPSFEEVYYALATARGIRLKQELEEMVKAAERHNRDPQVLYHRFRDALSGGIRLSGHGRSI